MVFNLVLVEQGVYMTPLERAIQIAGNQTALANALEVDPMTVSHWKSRGIPPKRVLSIFHVTGVTPHELRPDLHPYPNSGLPPEADNTPSES